MHIIEIGGDILTDTNVDHLPSLLDKDYTGTLSTIQSILNVFFIFTWVLMSVVVIGGLVALIVLLLMS
jgi:hypothetical protein